MDVIAAGFREVTLNGEPVDTTGYTPETGIALPDLAADNVLVVDADCLYTNTGEGLHRFVDPVDGAVYLYSQFETADAKRMYACFDQPDLKAPFTLTVTAPYDWEVVSNGRAVERHEGIGGAQVVRFATTPPLSPYVTALVAGPYHKVTDTHDGIDLGVYCRASLAEHLDADEILAGHQAGLRLVPPGVRLPLPVRQVRPALRPGVQRRRDGERGLRDLPGGLRLPVEGDRLLATSGAPRRSCTRWRTCGSATWSPCAGGTTSG